MSHIFDFFLEPYYTRESYLIFLEVTAFVFGVASVIYAKKENILVYPVGLVATVITVYIFWIDGLVGDMMMNFYYSVMSIYGWYNWVSIKSNKTAKEQITRTSFKEKIIGFILFVLSMTITYGVYLWFGKIEDTSNYVDIFTSGVFFTAMWYMANKKLENWTLWIFADLITVPLYAYRGWGMFSLQYLIFTVLAIQGYIEWKKNISSNLQKL